jgi:hypothetical protein
VKNEIVQMPKPKIEYLNNSKVANYIVTQTDLFSSTMQLTTIPKKNIFVTVDLTADQNLILSNPNITQYDLAVMDAVYTLLVNGAAAFTPEMVVRIMSGNFDQDVTPQKSGAVTKSLHKLSLIRITIDCTTELRARKKIDKDQTAKLTSYLMPLREMDIQSANHQVIMKGYQLIEKPVLYIYAEEVRQIIDIPTKLLEITDPSGSGHLSDTDDVIIIKRALIRRIELMKCNKNHMDNTTIRYEWYDPTVGTKKGFFAMLGFDASQYKNPAQWKKKRSSLNRIITTILNDFKREKYITDYEVVKEGKQKVTGVRIIL